MNTFTLRHFLPLILLPLLCVLPSCSDDDDPVVITADMGQTPLQYSADGVWTDVASNNSFALQYLQFNHEGEIGPWGLVWRGFTPARWAGLDYSTVTDWLNNSFQVPSRGGKAGVGTPYIVAFWDTQENESTPASDRTCRITYAKDATSAPLPFSPKNVYVQLTCYAYYTIKDGNAFSRPFAEGDWFRLTAHGVHADDTESTAEIYLADYRGESPELLDAWTSMDLSSLGSVKELYFTLDSSDTGQWGMNTPSYFAIDRLSVAAILPED